MSSKAYEQFPFELDKPGEFRGSPSASPVPHEVRPRSESSWCDGAVVPDSNDDCGFQTFVEGAGI
jgi:hypothetical protein